MSVDTRRAPDLDALLSALVESERHRYSVAWVDCLASGRHAGRGVVTSGEHAAVDELTGRLRDDPFAYDPKVRLRAPAWVPSGLLNRLSIAAFNKGWYGKAPARREGHIESIAQFFHPLDGVASWNTLYGRRGLVQYQCVVPDDTALRRVLDRLRQSRAPSFLAVLKRFGEGTPGLLSFPRPGWTLAVDLPTATPGLAPVLDALDDVVAEAGGSVYLAKDSRMRPGLVPVFYPSTDPSDGRWHALRDRVDPGRLFVSDQARRLSL
jgi:decaprenylphospho-beta-D-ribofuranose 2-oxidase